MLQIIFNNQKNQKWIFASLLLLISLPIYLFVFFGSNQVALSVASDPTRFDVFFGSFNISRKMPNSLKSVDYNVYCVDAINEDDFYEGGEFAYDDIYIVTFDSVGLQQSENYYYPLIKVTDSIKISLWMLQIYLVILAIVVGCTIYEILDSVKKEN